MDDIVKDVNALTDEEKAAAWEEYVRTEVNAALDLYLPKAVSGNIGIKYVPHLIEKLESGDQLDNSKADAVGIFIVLDFGTPLALDKPRE